MSPLFIHRPSLVKVSKRTRVCLGSIPDATPSTTTESALTIVGSGQSMVVWAWLFCGTFAGGRPLALGPGEGVDFGGASGAGLVSRRLMVIWVSASATTVPADSS